MSIVLLGAPYSGKGTQGTIISKKIGANYVAAGDLIRFEVINKTILGQKIEQAIEQGGLIEDDVMNPIMKIYFDKKMDGGNYVIDGFPRRISQINYLDKLCKLHDFSINHFIYLYVPEAELLRRAVIRSKTSTRLDDKNVNIHKHRISLFKNETLPAINSLKGRENFTLIDGLGSINTISERIWEKIDINKYGK